MAHQTTVNKTNAAAKPAAQGLARDIGGMAQDVLTLAELQVQLLATDIRECRKNLFAPSLLLLAGAALGLSCIPIALTALALGLCQFFHFPYALGFLLAALAGGVVSGLFCGLGWALLRKHANPFGRSQQELIRNLQWIKKVLKRRRITRNLTRAPSYRAKSSNLHGICLSTLSNTPKKSRQLSRWRA
jgi:Putative Actinobacterial Holin-X, holin superfamily III